MRYACFRYACLRYFYSRYASLRYAYLYYITCAMPTCAFCLFVIFLCVTSTYIMPLPYVYSPFACTCVSSLALCLRTLFLFAFCLFTLCFALRLPICVMSTFVIPNGFMPQYHSAARCRSASSLRLTSLRLR